MTTDRCKMMQIISNIKGWGDKPLLIMSAWFVVVLCLLQCEFSVCHFTPGADVPSNKHMVTALVKCDEHKCDHMFFTFQQSQAQYYLLR